ncbi:Hypothetical protein FKW44_010271 [Caligus rogercresseyi]|uniref:Uncharacterized protein n=1 Tax=Caligus rogercresseyi TaxID=217165 RepID=A0A7T8HGW1_CALRO|nr:Hypothetical protein FKW44_010271 [Caligus rogercresseyi]
MSFREGLDVLITAEIHLKEDSGLNSIKGRFRIGICYFHKNFGNKAYNCAGGCQFQKKKFKVGILPGHIRCYTTSASVSTVTTPHLSAWHYSMRSLACYF